MPVVIPDLTPAPGIARQDDGARVRPNRLQAGRWTIEIDDDRFAGAIRCVVRGPGIAVGPVAAVFALPRSTPSFDAIYRIDQGPPVVWRTVAIDLAAHGVRIEHDDLKNPSAGQVPVPLAAVANAQSIAIRADPAAPAYVFALDGLSTALAAAARAGCPRS